MAGSAAGGFVLALCAGVVAQLAARHIGVPSIVLLLGAGVLLGPDGLGFVDPKALGGGLHDVVGIAVAIILFEGGMSLDLDRLRHENKALRRLVTLGALVTAVGATLAARSLMGWPLGLAALFGTLVTVTGPTVIKPLLRIVPLRRRLATVLEAEAVLIDPIGAILAAVALEVVIGASLAEGAADLLLRFGVGGGLGIVGGGLAALALRSRQLVPDGMANLVALAFALGVHHLADSLVPESGILAVTLAGVAVGNFGGRRELGEIEEQLTLGLIGVLFVLLAANVRLADVVGLGSAGLATVAALALVVRPLNVFLSTAGSYLDLRERTFLAWVAPRGVVAAAVASLFAEALEARGLGGATEFRALVFLTIAVTVVVQGGSAPIVARLLGVRAPRRDAFVILGASELAFALAERLMEGGRPIVFIDSNPQRCRAAEERGHTVVFGDALAHATQARARFERARAAVGLTGNDEVNLLFCREAREHFGTPEVYATVARSDATGAERVLDPHGGSLLFGGSTDVDRWSQRLTRRSARAETWRFEGTAPTKLELPGNGGAFVILALGREGDWRPFSARSTARPGELAACLVHATDGDATAAHAALGHLGFAPVGS